MAYSGQAAGLPVTAAQNHSGSDFYSNTGMGYKCATSQGLGDVQGIKGITLIFSNVVLQPYNVVNGTGNR